MIHKLRRRFIIIAMVSVTAVMLLLAVSINVINFLVTDAELQDTLEMIAGNRGSMPPFPPDGPRPGHSREGHFTPETPFSTRYFVLRCDAAGELTGTDLRHIAAVTQADTRAYLSLALEHGEGFGRVGDSYRFYVIRTGEGWMAVFLDCQQATRSLRLFALASVLVAAACDILVYVLVLFLSRRAIDPVVKNAEKQKQFITDAGHELKTPLTVISTSLKVLEMDVGPQKWIDKIRAQTEKLSDLVGQLVTLSRLDEEKPPLQAAAFDVSTAVWESAESFRDYAAENGHALELDIAAGLTLRGDEYAVRQLVSVLLDNAVKYTDPDGTISLRLFPAKRGVTLETANACAAELEPDKLFDRFYRADRARTKQEDGGFGIGLSIARSIAEAHRGAIRADRPAPGQLRFTVQLRDIAG